MILSVCKGGGYRYARTDPPHPRANSNGLYPLHRVLMENKLGRLLVPGEDVHHKDEDKTNDDPSNLVVKSHVAHAAEHAAERAPSLVELVCGACGSQFTLKAHQHRLRLRRSASGVLGCSRSCGRRLAAASGA